MIIEPTSSKIAGTMAKPRDTLHSIGCKFKVANSIRLAISIPIVIRSWNRMFIAPLY